MTEEIKPQTQAQVPKTTLPERSAFITSILIGVPFTAFKQAISTFFPDISTDKAFREPAGITEKFRRSNSDGFYLYRAVIN